MNAQLQTYVPLLDFLSQILGEDTEIVMQDFTEGLDHSVVYIKNNLSGRKIGAPATDFVLEVLKNKVYKEKDYLSNYKTKTQNGNKLLSSTFFIKDEDSNLVGMICINSDKSKLFALKNILTQSLGSLTEALEKSSISSDNEDVVEVFYENTDSLIKAAIVQEVREKDKQPYILTKPEKIAIVKSLYEKRFFELKDSVSKVADAFQMSEVSIYKYIQTVKQEKERQEN